MDFTGISQKRRTIRFFRRQPVAKSHLIAMLDAARRVPSAANNQILRYTVVQDSDLAQAVFLNTQYAGRIKPHRSPEWGYNAPQCFIAISALKTGTTAPLMAYADAGAAIMAMQYAAFQENLGCCWLGSFKVAEVTRLLDIPEKQQLLFLLAVGHPAETPVSEDINADESVAYYLDRFDRLHVPKYTTDAITTWR